MLFCLLASILAVTPPASRTVAFHAPIPQEEDGSDEASWKDVRVEWGPVRIVHEPDYPVGGHPAIPRFAFSGRLIPPVGQVLPRAGNTRLSLVVARRGGTDPAWGHAVEADEETWIGRSARAPWPQPRDSNLLEFLAWLEEAFALEERMPWGFDDQGHFEVLVDPPSIRRVVGGTGRHKVALLAENVSFGGSPPGHASGRLLPKSIASHPIHGPDPLPPHLALVCEAPLLNVTLYEPAALVRVVNRLHALGYERALQRIRDYAVIAQHYHEYSGITLGPDEVTVDRADWTRLILLVHLLFEPDDGDLTRWPLHSLGPFSPRPRSGYPESSRLPNGSTLMAQYPILDRRRSPVLSPSGGSIQHRTGSRFRRHDRLGGALRSLEGAPSRSNGRSGGRCRGAPRVPGGVARAEGLDEPQTAGLERSR